MASRLAVLVATRGRPAVLKALLGHLARQTRKPDAVIVVGTEAADWAGVEPAPGLVLTHAPLAGLPAQRNHAMAIAKGFDAFAFFDDDFIPSRFWLEQTERLFAEDRDLAALTGRVLADGNRGPGIPLSEAEALVAAEDRKGGPPSGLAFGIKPYGCNMAFRASAIAGLEFDERLPLYAWLEDTDFGARVERRGKVVRAAALWGVHLGHKTGRVAGVRLGYSQIANPVYLTRKGTVPLAFSAKLMSKNIIANALRSFRPEPLIDRAGRLRGNLIALGDLARGRVTPERAARL